uniref:ATP synthase subunit a n=1 Tax=Columbicola columbae TaxID=128991 RepID=A0A6G7SJU1_9NEOP|nr:ATP synthase F0 subunit 6 [Columbicola columbae]
MSHSLMSIFDPEAFNLPLKWFQCLTVFFLLNWSFYCVEESWKMFLKKVMMSLIKLFSQGIHSPKLSSVFFISLFIFLFLINESGMFPFVFTSSSHLVFNFCFSLPFWLGGLLLLDTKAFLAHLVPQGSPVGLSPFLVFIEMASLLIRPISLGVRLMSNIMAGHMVLCLIQSLSGFSSLSTMVSIILSSLFLSFEVAVALVQAFVFVNLSNMYLKESESH